MRYEVEIGGRRRQVVVHRADGCFVVTVDGQERTVDAARLDAHTISLCLHAAGGSRVDPMDTTVVSREVTLARDGVGQLRVGVGPSLMTVSLNGRRRSGRVDDGGSGSGPQRLTAPMPGRIVRVLVAAGDQVHARQPLVVVEAMKMENELRAALGGSVTELHAREGQSVEAGALLAVITPAETL